MKVRDKIWKAIRVEGRFDIDTIAFYAGTTRNTVKVILRSLLEHGYVEKVKVGRRVLFSLVEDERRFPTVCKRCGKKIRERCGCNELFSIDEIERIEAKYL